MNVGKMIEQEEHAHAKKNYQRHFDAGFAIDLRHQVGGGDVDSDTGGKRQSKTNLMPQQSHGQHAGDGGRAQQG